MDFYKRWLINYLDLDIDVKNYIKNIIPISVINPLVWNKTKFMNNIHVNNNIHYRAPLLGGWHPEYNLYQTRIHFVNHMVNKIVYLYKNHLERLLGYMIILVDFELSHINPNHIQIYSRDQLPSSCTYITEKNILIFY